MRAEPAAASGGPSSTHPWLAAYAAVGVLAVAVFASLLSGPDGGLALGLASATGGASSALEPLANVVPAAYAFGAGVLAAVNPCGFAMLPGFVALYLRDSPRERVRVGSVVAVSATITVAFVVLFGVVGLLLSVAGATIGDALPAVSLLVGVIVVVAGARMLTRRPIYVGLGASTGALSRFVQARNIGGYAAYGLAYGLTSLSCTLPIFLAVVGTSSTAHSLGASVGQFVLYALGMGLVILVAAIVVGSVRATALQRLRRAGRSLNLLAGAVVMLVGAYIVYYWLTFGQIAIGPRA